MIQNLESPALGEVIRIIHNGDPDTDDMSPQYFHTSNTLIVCTEYGRDRDRDRRVAVRGFAGVAERRDKAEAGADNAYNTHSSDLESDSGSLIDSD